MNTRLIRSKTSGQSIPLIALMIVVLFAMVALAVDVGNTYAEQRNTVRASNAAALAGMNTLINGGDDTSVRQGIVQSLTSNNIHVAAPGALAQSGERVLTANYLDSSGNPLASCPNVGSGCSASALRGATYIRVSVDGLVDTFFARIVGRPTLPVGANAFAQRGVCTDGIYPITVRGDFLNENGFIDPNPVRYNVAPYRNKTVKRVYMHDTSNPSGGFNWLYWKGTPQSGNTGELIDMLSGPGNVAEGISEVNPWPVAPNVLAQPNGYPGNPGMLNSGDWIHNNTGVQNANEVRNALDYHIQNRTEMKLPIHDIANGDGNSPDASYHISGLGKFLLLGYDLSGHGWFDLVYLGDTGDCATLTTNVPHPTNLGITGQVVFRPRNRVAPQSRPPVQYEIILDVSGSMGWKFDGYGWKGSAAVLCTGATVCNGNDFWPDEKLRRIYIAKQALNSFIDGMQPNDSMRIIAFSDNLNSNYSNQRAIDNLTKAWPADGWSNNKADLKAAVQSAGKVGSDPYRTWGLTPSAAGLAAGNQALAAAPTTDPVSHQTYRRVVIFLTDGVANVFRNGSVPNYPNGCGPDIASPCNTGNTNSSPPVAMPINAMGLEADSLKQLATIYVIALAGVDATGLTNVAQAPNYPYYSEAPNGSELQGILAAIATNVQYGTCVPVDGDTWKDTIADGEVGDVPPPQGPLVHPTVGYVYLRTETGAALPNGQGQAPIQVNPETGKMTYHFDNLTPGTYQMSAFVGYKGSDGISRIYNMIYNPNTAVEDTTMTFPLGPSNALGTVVPMDLLSLDMSGSVCPTP